jgi:hypothetical protein
VGWWEAGGFRTAKATVENISLEGALTRAEQAPPLEGSVWVCLDGIPPSAWVEARVIEFVPESEGSSMVRLKFQERCPFGFFNSAIRHFSRDEGLAAAPSSEAGSGAGAMTGRS